ncbi:hypothetical protein BDW22DRAFT_1011331 [Trametopsis cervina]|nr:hypothetical protein BDW22DRAFT_1011331 [Trametopsis cervina]
MVQLSSLFSNPRYLVLYFRTSLFTFRRVSSMSTVDDVDPIPTVISEAQQPQNPHGVYNVMRESMKSAREVIQSIQAKVDSNSLDTAEGISLLSLKNHLMLSYLQSLVILTARRAIGDSLSERSPPSESFSTPNRSPRGDGAGDRVDALIEGRIVLEKIKVLEGRMKYQIEKLVRVAEEGEAGGRDAVNDPLAFKPNPQNLLNQEMGSDDEEEQQSDAEQVPKRTGIYRPPKLAPMPYTETTSKSKEKKTRNGPLPTALKSLAHLDPTLPFAESTSGLGSTPSLMSGRAKELTRMTEFEEENFTRLVMKKKDARRRKADEADLALGGTGMTGRSGRGAGLEDEFGDILRDVGRKGTSGRGGVVGDGYEELRMKGKKGSVLERSRVRPRDDGLDAGAEEGPRERKRSRFEKEVKASKKRTSMKSKR